MLFDTFSLLIYFTTTIRNNNTLIYKNYYTSIYTRLHILGAKTASVTPISPETLHLSPYNQATFSSLTNLSFHSRKHRVYPAPSVCATYTHIHALKCSDAFLSTHTQAMQCTHMADQSADNLPLYIRIYVEGGKGFASWTSTGGDSADSTATHRIKVTRHRRWTGCVMHWLRDITWHLALCRCAQYYIERRRDERRLYIGACAVSKARWRPFAACWLSPLSLFIRTRETLFFSRAKEFFQLRCRCVLAASLRAFLSVWAL